MIRQPHSSWAEVYDAAYQRSFGGFYHQLTEVSVKWISEIVPPPAKIVDFGAGTGRLSIPLSQMKYEVTAVEPCREMLDQLRRKDQQKFISSVCAPMEKFRGEGEFDLALCVFTVILYLLDEGSLKRSLTAAYEALRPGGRLLLDVPVRSIFQSYARSDHGFERVVTITHQSGDKYNYREELEISNDGGNIARYEDEFQIRYWSGEQVMGVLDEIGFVDGEDVTSRFLGAGSSYYRFRKPVGV
jgi:2-polyprenyl-3-methyl-5-hydroxy-6-metoxy-1,4-benzoquinol methylase